METSLVRTHAHTHILALLLPHATKFSCCHVVVLLLSGRGQTDAKIACAVLTSKPWYTADFFQNI